jgi:hypothetical protein
MSFLKEAKYGIWVGCSESQGFALEETLSCNVPLFVWSVSSLTQEYRQNYPDISATTIPYWDERCGEYIHNMGEIEEKFTIFLQKVENGRYKPREFVLENLSIDVCERKMIELINDIK